LYSLLTVGFLLGNLLLPKLEKSVDKGEEARVLSVLAAGKGGTIDMDDLGLKKSSGLKRKADSATTYNDLMVEVRFEMSLEADATGVGNSTPQNRIYTCLSRHRRHQSG